MSVLAPYLKAVTAAIVAALGVVASGLDSGGLSTQECVYAVIAFLVGLGAVWAVPNRQVE